MIRQRRKRITPATLATYAAALGRDSIAYRALRQLRELSRDGIRADTYMTNNGFQLVTVCHTYKFG